MPTTSAFRRPSTRALLAATLTAAAASLAATAGASAGPDSLVAAGAGLTAPEAVAQTPDGVLWVADALLGVCEVRPGGGRAPVAGPYCMDEHSGPVKPTGLVFDARTSSFYASDEVSSGGAVWRLHWDATARRIAAAERIAFVPGDRVTAIATSDDGELFYATKRSTAITRLSIMPGTPTAPQVVGHARRPDPSGLAVLGGSLYLAESDVTRIGLAAGARLATPVPGLAGIPAGDLAADRARGRLYVGTAAHGRLVDELHVLDPATGVAEPYERGFTGVTGLGVAKDGAVMVADDPATAAGVIDAADGGRIWRVPLRRLGLPGVRIVAGPAAHTSLRSLSFTYASRPGTTFECRVDGRAWAPCPGSGEGATVADVEAEGAHAFEVRALDAGEAGLHARRTFVVDRTAPRVRIAAPADGDTVRPGAVVLDVVASEAAVSFACSVDGGPADPCDPGTELTGLADGRHELRVLAVDAAGNRSDAAAPGARSTFRVATPPAAPRSNSGDHVAARPDPRATPPATPVAPVVPSAKTGTDVATAFRRGLPRLRALRLRRTRLRASRDARVLRMDLVASPTARTLELAVLRIGARRAPRVLATTMRVRPGISRVGWRLSRAESARLRPGLHLLTAWLADERGAVGNLRARLVRVVPSGAAR